VRPAAQISDDETAGRGARGAGVIAVGAALLLAAVAEPLVAQRWTQRIPPGWSWHARFVGASATPDPETGLMPPTDDDGAYEREMHVVSDEDRPRSVLVEDRYFIHDLKSDRITFQYVYRAQVDPRTGRHVEPAWAGDAFVFPRNVTPGVYRLRFSYLKGVPVSFVREETIADLRTYLFEYYGRAEYTESYAGTAHFPGTIVRPGQEIRCRDDQFLLRVWVEPDTGEMLAIEDSCYSTDWVYDVATNTPLRPVLRWGGKTTGDDVVERADALRAERLRQGALSRWLPIVLLVAGGGCGVVGLLRRRAGTPA
jgi:hypothetical protein